MTIVRGEAAPPLPAGLDTFPRLLRHHAEVRGAQPAVREKEYGIWQTYTWADYYRTARAVT